MLARTMASYVDPRVPGPVIELGPGTGPVTDALVRRGVAQDRLVLVEYNPDFCKLLKRKFPKATIVQGDAYELGETLRDALGEPDPALYAAHGGAFPVVVRSVGPVGAVVVSGLPQ